MRSKLLPAMVAGFCLLQGCSSIGVDQMTFGKGLVTSVRGTYPFDETPVKAINQRDSLVVITHLKWEPPGADGGSHAVSWTWYQGEKVVAVRKKDVRFDKSPFRLTWRIPAGDFEPGHYRVDVAVDNKVVDTQEYDILK
jgi:hypothetical protein